MTQKHVCSVQIHYYSFQLFFVSIDFYLQKCHLGYLSILCSICIENFKWEIYWFGLYPFFLDQFPVCMYLESTSTLILRFLLFFIFILAHIFNSFLALLHWLGIIYLFWEFTEEISYTMPTRDLLQNSTSYYPLCHLHYLILLESFISSLTVFLYSSW